MESNVTKVVGKQVLDFVNKETGEKIVGVNLFINRPDENVDGLKAVKQFIGTTSSAYSQALNLDFSNGSLDCVFNYSFQVGQKRPVLTSIDVVGCGQLAGKLLGKIIIAKKTMNTIKPVFSERFIF